MRNFFLSILTAFAAAQPVLAATTTRPDGELWYPEPNLNRYPNPQETHTLEEFRAFRAAELKFLDRWCKEASTDIEIAEIEKTFGDIEPILAPSLSAKFKSTLDGQSVDLAARAHGHHTLPKPVDRNSGEIRIASWLNSAQQVILEKQGNFLRAFRDYLKQTDRLRSAQAEFDAITNGAGIEWNKYDPRIAPYMRTSAEQILVYQAQRAQQAKGVLLGLTSESFLNDTDKAFGGDIDWSKTQQLAANKSLLARNEQPVSPEMGLYSQTAERLFADQFKGFAPSLVLVAKVNRTGMRQIHVLKSSGKSSLDEEAVRVAKQLALSPFPKSYTGDHWFLILRKFGFVPKIESASRGTTTTPTQSEIDMQVEQDRNVQERDMQAKKLRYGVSYPWEMTEPYGLVRER